MLRHLCSLMHCCSYLPDTMPLWQTEHGTMRIKKKRGSSVVCVCVCVYSMAVLSIYYNMCVYDCVYTVHHGSRQETLPVDGDDKMAGQSGGFLWPHYFIVNIARGGRKRTLLFFWKQRQTSGFWKDRRGGWSVKMLRFIKQSRWNSSLEWKLGVVGKRHAKSTVDWVSACWANSAATLWERFKP